MTFEIEDVPVTPVARGARPEASAGAGGGTDAPGPPGRRRPRLPGPAARALLLVGGLAVAIVGAGLLGPRPDPPVADPTPPPAERPVPATSAPDAAVPVPSAPVPLFRRSGTALADQHVLVAGRWMHLATGLPVAGAPDGCARQRVLVLGSGRIVCLTADITRSPGSRLALYDLSATTVGDVRTDRGAPPPADAPAGAPGAQALATLLGQRDVVIGDPVAVATAPGPGPDDLVLAWAAIDDGRFEIGLEAFRLGSGDGPAARLGDWTVGRASSIGRDAVDTLADLAVTVDPSTGRALVGWTEAGPGIAGPVRRLVAVRLDGSGTPTALPAAATRNLAPGEADGPLRTGTPCGGGFGEGLGADGTAWVVCPGTTATLRVLGLGDGGGAAAGRVVAEVPLLAAGTTAGTAWLAGNGVATDPAGSVVYRWAPAVRTLWRVELGAGPGGEPRVASAGLLPRRGALETGITGDAGDSVGARPILALDAARGRLYALEAPVPGVSGRAVIHVIDANDLRYLWSFPLADAGSRAVSLSPDGRLIYASTAPRLVGSPPDAVGVAVLDARTGIELAYAGRLRVGAAGPLQAVIVR